MTLRSKSLPPKIVEAKSAVKKSCNQNPAPVPLGFKTGPRAHSGKTSQGRIVILFLLVILAFAYLPMNVSFAVNAPSVTQR